MQQQALKTPVPIPMESYIGTLSASNDIVPISGDRFPSDTPFNASDRLFDNKARLIWPPRLPRGTVSASCLDNPNVVRAAQSTSDIRSCEVGTLLETPAVVVSFQEQTLRPVVKDQPDKRLHNRVFRLHGRLGMFLLQVPNDAVVSER